jgi:hypothetical protein
MIQNKSLCFELKGIQEGNQEGKDFFEFIKILLNQAQDIKIWSDGEYVTVEYDDSNQEYGGPILEWIDPSTEYVARYDKEEDTEYDQDGDTEE